MEPTMHTNEYLLVNKVSYMVGDPQRGDIVVLRYPQDPRRDFIKRIIALPGEEVEVRGGSVYINGRALEEPYIKDRPVYTYPKKRVPENDFFVLGDNRNNSHDSHVWDWLPRDYLIGKAWVAYWPIQEWGVLHHDTVHYAAAAAAPAPVS
jgi:signal peptidase I